jgi:hypothetical protein
LISRREEWMSSECLFTGRVTCLDGDTGEVTAELSYGTVSKTVPAKPCQIRRQTRSRICEAR